MNNTMQTAEYGYMLKVGDVVEFNSGSSIRRVEIVRVKGLYAWGAADKFPVEFTPHFCLLPFDRKNNNYRIYIKAE